MTEADIRNILVECFESANVLAMRDKGLTPVLLGGHDDILFEHLDMDSLDAMELCIATEVNMGVSIVPDDLQSIGSLNRLVAYIQDRPA